MTTDFDDAVSYPELCRAITECKKGVSYKDGPMDWYLHRLLRAETLRQEIVSGRYRMRPGTVVQIYRPKRREAVAPWFKDRVWQRSMCNNGIYRDLTAPLIYDNGACQKGKGTDLAIKRTVRFLREIYRETGNNDAWALHMDVKKYFPSTPHDAIKDLDRRAIRDERFIPYLSEIIDSVEGLVGTGLGSQINQLHQVALLDRIDHELKTFCRHYQRYMDDFLILDPDREILRRAEDTIRRMLTELDLEVKSPHGCQRLRDGFWFLRHRFILTDTGKVIVRLHPDTIRNEKTALKALRRAQERGEVDWAYILAQYQTFVAQTAYCSGSGALVSMDRFYTKLFRRRPVYSKGRKKI